MLVDSHAHIQHPRYAATEEGGVVSAEALLADAAAQGVGHVLNVACRREEWAPALALAEQHPKLVSVVAGIHPNDAGEGGVVTPEELNALANHPAVVALGETGLDDAPHNTASQTDQLASLHVHAAVARAHGLPLVIHTRDAEAATLEALKQHAGVPFVLHCFSGTQWLAEEALALGGYISFSGILTFKKSHDLRHIAAHLPRSRVLVETDAPYLSPEPVRNQKRCTPAMVAHTAKVLADAWQISPAAVAEITTANCVRLFPRLQGRGFLAS
jgi:TatD DNase family protein